MAIRMRPDRRQHGFTLTELMIALVLGLLVVLAAAAMVVTSRASYRTQDEATRLAENGRFAVELLTRQIRQAGYTDFGESTTPPASFQQDPFWNGNVYYNNSSNVGGVDNASINFAAPINGSDVLLVWYYGSGAPGTADGNITDCAGIPVASPTADATAYTNAHVRMVFEVVNDVDGEPSLGCRRDIYDPVSNTKTSPISGDQILVRGVESFQVLFGEAIYAAGADPDQVPPVSIVYRTGQGGSNPVGNWLNVVSVRFSLLLRSNTGAQPDTTAQTYYLFGPSYTGTDPGVQFSTASLSTAERTRLRRVVQTTVSTRNRQSAWPSLQ